MLLGLFAAAKEGEEDLIACEELDSGDGIAHMPSAT